MAKGGVHRERGGVRRCESARRGKRWGVKGMSETRAEDVTPLTERKSINSSFLWPAVSAMRDCSQVSNLKGDVRANGKRLYDYVISRKKSGGWEERGGREKGCCLGAEKER